MAYTHLLLDLDGTIVDSRQLQYDTLAALFAHLALPLSREMADTFFQLNIDYWKRYEAGEIAKETLRLGRFVDLAHRYGLPPSSAAQLAAHYPTFSQASAPVYDGALDTLAQLKAHCTISMITNGFSEIQHNKIALSGIGPYFDHVFIGEELGAMKPDIRFFNQVYTAIGAPCKREILVVGDSLLADIQGGNGFGLDTCWINNEGQVNDTNLMPDYGIFSLAELPAIVYGEQN